MPRAHVYRRDDLVEIVNPVFVKRVGYPLEVREVAVQLHRTHRADIIELINKIEPTRNIYVPDYGVPQLITDGPLAGLEVTDGEPMTDDRLPYDRHGYRKMLEGLALMLVRHQGFGGRERSLHTVEIPELAGKTFLVCSKCNVKTGTYYPPGGSYEDYEPGGLSDAKTHVLLDVLAQTGQIHTNKLQIEACNVKPYKE